MTQSNEPSTIDMNSTIAMFDGWKIFKGDPAIVCPSCDEGKIPSGWCICDQKTDRFQKDGKMVGRTYFQYHTSWDWLMPVVEKIESIENKRFGVCIDVLDTMIMDYKVGEDEGERILIQTDIYPDNGDTKISITHNAVYQFITWLNQQTTTNGTKQA